MPTNSIISRIVKAFPDPGFSFHFLTIISLLLLLTSCFNGNYKSEVEESANIILENMKLGNFSQIPNFEEAMNNLDSTAALELKDSLENMKDWEISVGKPKKNRVKASVKIIMNENHKILDLFFTKIDGQWVPEKEISINQSINFIPFIGAKPQS